MILARLLFPEAFGLMALVRVVQNGLTLASDMGVRLNIIQHDSGDEPAFLNTAWTLQVLRGLLLWTIGTLIAVPLARAYDEPELAYLIPVVVLTAVITGFESTNIATRSRHLALGRIVALTLSSQIVAMIAMIGVALLYRTVWALVVGTVVSCATRTILSHFVLPGIRNRFSWKKDVVRDIVSFGKWILFSTFITFLAQRLDILMLGKLVPLDMLGVYSIALIFATLPRRLASPLATQVMLPVLATIRRADRSGLHSAFRRARRVILPAGLLLFLATGLLTPPFIHFVYDERYHSAGWIAQLLVVPLWFAFLHVTGDRGLLAVGDSRGLAVANAVKLASTAAAGIIGFWLGGLPAFILGLLFGAVCGYSAAMAFLGRHGLSCWTIDLRYSLLGLGLGVSGALVPRLVFPGLEPTGQMLVTIAAALVILAPFGLWTGYFLWRELR
jgi:O-antigen/teichoic acid export membrane protein